MIPDPPTVRRVLVVFKTSPFELYGDQGLLEGVAERGPDQARVVDRLRSAHEEHRRTVEIVAAELTRSDLDVLVRNRPTKRETAGVDLVITVGGDGTFLGSARRVDATPMLGVNSAPRTSVGNYCGATADTFAEMLGAIRDGDRAGWVDLRRIRIHIRDRLLPHSALNDVLICHRAAAAASRYLLRVGDHDEWQTSSGVWISTASGSTGAMHSAGGEAMAPDDARLQYLVREPCVVGRAPYSLTRGYVSDGLELVSRGPHLTVYLDGHHSAYQVGLCASVRVSPSPTPLWVYGFRGRPR